MMSSETSAAVWGAGAAAAGFAIPVFFGAIKIATRIAELETKIEPMWKWWLTTNGNNDARAKADSD